jgi:hypothetical protein
MKVHGGGWRGQLILSLIVAVGFVFTTALASSRAIAQATADQRAACEDEARWLCSNYIPDERAITACMVRNRAVLSPRCRAMLGSGPKQGEKRRK